MLGINDITYGIGGRRLLEDASVALPAGARVGLVGRNGAGKTTLFRIIAGELTPEQGEVRLSPRSRIGRLAQEAPDGPESLLEVVLAADTERAQLLAAAETEHDPTRIAEIQTRLADIGAHSAPARAAEILAGLGFSHAEQQRPCSEFSGGWRMRVALAATLFAEPDLLLLDEPTNYLDLEATLWLEEHIARYPRTVIVISHDRDLLDNAVDWILHLEAGKLALYRGGYSAFERQRRERQMLDVKLARKQEAERKRLQAFVDRFRAKATKARQAQSRVKLLAKLEPVAAVIAEEVRPIEFPPPAKPLSPPIIALDDVVRRLRAGPPGAAAPHAAHRRRRSHRAARRQRQRQIDAGEAARRAPGADVRTDHAAAAAGGRLFRPASARRIACKRRRLRPSAPAHARCAGGQGARARRSRRAFRRRSPTRPPASSRAARKRGCCSASRPSPGRISLMLDEPTNHLDIDSRSALIAAINDFPGAVILVSHDRYLIEACADRLLLVADGRVAPFDGDLDDYRRLVLGGPTRQRAAKSRIAAEPLRQRARGTR